MLRKITSSLFVIGLLLMAAVPVFAGGPGPKKNADAVVYVTSQELYFDTNITGAEFTPHGKFQQLFPPGTNPAWPVQPCRLSLDRAHPATVAGAGGLTWTATA